MTDDERALADAVFAAMVDAGDKLDPYIKVWPLDATVLARFTDAAMRVFRAHEAAGRAEPMVDDLCAYCGQRRADWTHDAREAPSGLVHKFLERRPASPSPETIEAMARALRQADSDLFEAFTARRVAHLEGNDPYERMARAAWDAWAVKEGRG